MTRGIDELRVAFDDLERLATDLLERNAALDAELRTLRTAVEANAKSGDFPNIGKAGATLLDRALDRLEEEISRSGEGNPNHDDKGQFSSSGHAAHGKHHARRERRKRKLAAIRKRYHREAAGLKSQHRKDRASLLGDHRKAHGALRKEHAGERKEHVKWEHGERKSLAKEHATAHKDVDREHAAAAKRHEKGAAKEHAAIDKEHAAKADRIAKGERKAKNTDKRHARERDENETSIGKIGDTVATLHKNELAKAHKEGKGDDEIAAIHEKHAGEREKAKDFPERRRKRLAEKHDAEKAKAKDFLDKAPALKERLDKQTAAKHDHIDKRPERLEAKRQKMHGGLDRRQKRERREQRGEHRQARQDLRDEHKDARQSLKADHKEERESLKDQDREERKDLVGQLKDELAEHGFKRKSDRAGARSTGLDGIERKAIGNPNHKGKGEGGGQFADRPGGGGGGASAGHGKHWARRQRRKERLKRKRESIKKRHRSERKSLRDEYAGRHDLEHNPAAKSAIREEYRQKREKLRESHRGERESFRSEVKEKLAPKAKARDFADADPKEVERAWSDLSADWRKSLSAADRADAEKYSGYAYEDVNDFLRKGKVRSGKQPITGESRLTKDQARRLADGIDRSLRDARLPESVVVYRGIADARKLGLGDPKPGTIIRDQGFLSTSLTPKVADGFAAGKDSAILRITAPKGSHGASLGGISMVPREREVVFARGASLKITKVEKHEGKTILHARLGHEGHAEARTWLGDVQFGEIMIRSFEESDDRLASKFGWDEGDIAVEGPTSERSLDRASKGNPNHVKSGEHGGEFASGSGAGGSDKAHGKHHAKNQRKRKRKAKRPRRKVAHGYKAKSKGGPKDEARAAAAKATYKPCNKAEKDYAKANEHRFASHIGGKSYPDNDPSDVDVTTPSGGHHLELKSMLTSGQGKANMARESIGRKVALSKETGNPFHMVILDDRDVYNAGAHRILHSGHRMYFKDGVARYNIKDMHPVKDEAEIRKILDTPYDQWPEKAKASKNAVAGMDSKWIKKSES